MTNVWYICRWCVNVVLGFQCWSHWQSTYSAIQVWASLCLPGRWWDFQMGKQLSPLSGDAQDIRDHLRIGALGICTNFYHNPSISCQDNLLNSKNINLMVALEERSGGSPKSGGFTYWIHTQHSLNFKVTLWGYSKENNTGEWTWDLSSISQWCSMEPDLLALYSRAPNSSLFWHCKHIYHISVETELVSVIVTDFVPQVGPPGPLCSDTCTDACWVKCRPCQFACNWF